MKKKRFHIYNKSSERMNEVKDSSIDLAVTDPPFNIGGHFGEIIDDSSHQKYISKLQRVIAEIARVLSPEGLALFLVPTVVRRGGQLYEYPQIYSKLCNAEGLKPLGNISYRVTEEDRDCVPETEIRTNPLKGKSHSDKIIGLMFSKSNREVKSFPKNRLYRYVSREGHPCPYPQELINDVLDTYFSHGAKVIDPFMGTAGIGKEIIKRGGIFYGYEQAQTVYEIALRKLSDY